MSTSERQLRLSRFGDKGTAEMVWTCVEEEQWLYWTKDTEYGAISQEQKKEHLCVN